MVGPAYCIDLEWDQEEQLAQARTKYSRWCQDHNLPDRDDALWEAYWQVIRANYILDRLVCLGAPTAAWGDKRREAERHWQEAAGGLK